MYKVDYSGKVIIQLQNVDVKYNQKKILNGLSFEVQQGESVGIAGLNGTGKTTLFKLLLGQVQSSNGQVNVLGETLRNKRNFRKICREFAYIPQQTTAGKLPLTVLDAVMMGRWGRNLSFFKKPTLQDNQKVFEALELVNMVNKVKCDYRFLSGGEQQKVAIARAIAREASIYLLDEPTTYLDETAKQELQKIITQLRVINQPTMLIISHDASHLNEITDKIYKLDQGKLYLQRSNIQS